MTDVSQETCRAEVRTKRGYFSPAKQAQAAASREAMIQAGLRLMDGGRFRLDAKDICRASGHASRTFHKHFGSVRLFGRVLAREHGEAIAAKAGLLYLDERERKRLVWLLMVGERKVLV